MNRALAAFAAAVVATTSALAIGIGAGKPQRPFQACEALLEHYPENVGGDHAKKVSPGLYEILNSDCTTQTTHGPDEHSKMQETPEEIAGTSSTSTTTLQAAGKPVCATDNAFEALYLVPSGQADNYSSNAQSWRNAILQADGKLNLETQNKMGSTQQSHYKAVCNSDGTIKVTKVLMNAPNNATFSTITTELRNKGYSSSGRKYWAYWQGTTSSGFSGQANAASDSSDSSSNQSMFGNQFAINYGNFSWSTAMHESFHNLGAVQNDAPDSSGGHHCDGDKATGGVMCYDDGGATWDAIQTCGNPPSGTVSNTNLDWCDNDFWAPNHRSDSTYIGTHWNIAECATGPSGGKWLVSTVCGWVPPGGPTPTPTPTATATTTPPATQAVYDATLGAPKCATVQAVCDTGPTLVKGKDTLTGGVEQNQPNTVDACTDGTTTDAGYGVDESVESVKVQTSDGTAFATGKSVLVTVKAYIYSTTDDRLDIWSSPTAISPSWTLVTTLTPTATGLQTLTATYTLLTGSTQAVRASLRWQGSAIPCTTSNYDDPDDLAFASGTGPTPTPTPTATTTVTPSPTPTPTATGTAQCSDTVDNNANGKIDAGDNGCVNQTVNGGPYSYTPSDNDEVNHIGQWSQMGPNGCDGSQPFVWGEHKADDTTICHVDRDGVI